VERERVSLEKEIRYRAPVIGGSDDRIQIGGESESAPALLGAKRLLRRVLLGKPQPRERPILPAARESPPSGFGEDRAIAGAAAAAAAAPLSARPPPPIIASVDSSQQPHALAPAEHGDTTTTVFSSPPTDPEMREDTAAVPSPDLKAFPL
jgi:hypothetical protein